MSSKIEVVYHSSTSDDDNESDGEYSSTADAEDSSGNEASKKTEQKKAKTKPRCIGSNAVVDVMAKILCKQIKDEGSVILSKGSTDKQIQTKRKLEQKKESSLPNDDDSDNSDVDGQKLTENKRQKRLWEQMGRIKPTVFDREKEKALQRIATRGVVQLFNAVKKQQKMVDDKMQEIGTSVRKRDKVMQTMTKGKFLDVLKGTSVSNITNEPPAKQIKMEVDEPYIKQEKEDPSWNILRDDFMMGAKMKDWDKVSDDSDGLNNTRRSVDSDSDT